MQIVITRVAKELDSFLNCLKCWKKMVFISIMWIYMDTKKIV